MRQAFLSKNTVHSLAGNAPKMTDGIKMKTNTVRIENICHLLLIQNLVTPALG